MMNRCLICMHETRSGQEYHGRCLQRLFGSKEVPKLDYSEKELRSLTQKIIRQPMTVLGVQAKLSMEIQQEAKETQKLTNAGLWGRFILKPTSGKWPQLPENEHCTLRMADELGIETAPCGLIRLKSGELAFITRRIDRWDEGSKLAMEDMCQLTGRLTEDKYKGSHEQIAKVIKKYTANPLYDIIRFFEVVLFSYLTGNGDRHLKNYSLFKDPKIGWKFAPTYDLLSTRLVIAEKFDPEELALTVRGKKSRFNLDDFKQFGLDIGLTSKQITNEFTRLQSKKSDLESIIQRSFLSNEMKENYMELLNERYDMLWG